uniref:Uncharacterized protein n=1 Tax=Triticum urartu TaxID=4572 RepID=A0A8R7TZ18_TRIUA
MGMRSGLELHFHCSLQLTAGYACFTLYLPRFHALFSRYNKETHHHGRWRLKFFLHMHDYYSSRKKELLLTRNRGLC